MAVLTGLQVTDHGAAQRRERMELDPAKPKVIGLPGANISFVDQLDELTCSVTIRNGAVTEC